MSVDNVILEELKKINSGLESLRKDYNSLSKNYELMRQEMKVQNKSHTSDIEHVFDRLENLDEKVHELEESFA